MQTVPLIFRCDASSEIGWGHFRRCYALAEVAQQSGRFKVYFLTRSLARSLDKKLSEIHATSQKLPDEANLEQDLTHIHSMFDLMSRKNIVVVVDHYDWTYENFKEIKSDPRVTLLAFDDGQKRSYHADFLINQNIDAEKIAYAVNPECQQLLGPKYVMIRDEITTLRQHPTERVAEVFQFVVTLGGGDRWGHSLKAIEAARMSPHKFETHVVVGSGWPHVDKAKRLIGNHPRIHLYEDPSFFPQLISRADLCMSAGGSTTYELAFLGVPMMTTTLVAHQNAIAQSWSERGISDHIGPAELLTPEIIMNRIHYWMDREQELENRGVEAQKVVDGRGKFRVLERLSKVLGHK